MSYINTNISSMIAVNALNNNQASLQTSLQRLSTGYSINSGKDNPSGLIASQALLAEQTGAQTAISNSQQANNVIGTAEGALSEVSNLLISLQGLVNSSANSGAMSSSQLSANQLQVDSILSTINRISNTTNFQGQQLLNGSLGYTTSGVNSANISQVQINSAQVPQGGSTNVVVQVMHSALAGQVIGSAGTAGLASATTMTISGNLGSQQVSFAAGAKASAIIAAVNQYTSSTGVKAVTSGTYVKFGSSTFGSSQFVSVTSSSSNFKTYKGVGITTAGSTDYGQNATVNVNGQSVTSNGLSLHVVTGNIDANLTLSSAFAQQTATTTNFQITGGGATFSLGDQVNASGLASIGIQSANTSALGTFTDTAGQVVSLSALGSGQAAAVDNNGAALAQQLVNNSINQVSTLRGRMGAFQANVLSSIQNSLNVTVENIASSYANIANTDFASQTAQLTQSQILVQAATGVLAQANAAPQNVLKLIP